MTNETSRQDEIVILMVDDDPEDIFLTEHAFKKGKLANDFRSVGNGQEMMDYLRHEGEYVDPKAHPRPHIILLDINMPIMNGFEALTAIRSDPAFADMPVVIMTTSNQHIDISKGYAAGASSYLSKPVTPAAMMEVVEVIENYWVKIVEIPKA
ncbi:response regulator [Minwuia sp.]|uniref:response regulator n=1 Tax=Minwuia sp. TaxID=2493630 RepID=UPI003A8CBDF9